MVGNYFKVTVRNLLKNKLFSITNIAGLGIGIACCLLILLFVNYEMSYEKWNPYADRIYRPHMDINFGGSVMTAAVAGAPIAPDAAAELPEIENWCRFRDYGSYLVRVEGTGISNFSEDAILTVDSTFFDLFPVKLLAGDKRTALTLPNTLVMSKSQALKYFGTVDQAMGKVLILENEEPWEVKGVYENIPPSTHFKADFLLSMNGNEEVANAPPLWAANNNFHTYLLLKEGTDGKIFEEKFDALSKQKMEETSSQLLGMTLAEFEATGQYARYGVQKMKDIHLHSDLQVELEPNGSFKYVLIFSAIALFVLLIACINFMNLTTAKSTQRSKEIGIRKVLGSNRQKLISQFFSETFIMTFLSVLLALSLAAIAMPWFNELTTRDISIPWTNASFWLVLIGGMIVVSLVAGSYPAIFLSSFDPIQSLQPARSKQGKHGRLRSSLVVFQFAIAITLIIGTMLIYNQLQFIQSKKLGFNKEQVIVIDDAYALEGNLNAFKQKILQEPTVSSATISSYLPIPSSRSNTTYSQSREFRQDHALNMQRWLVDHDYLNTIGMTIKEGRYFDRAFPTDSQAVILNEAAIKILGYTNPVGKKIYGLTGNLQGPPAPDDFIEYHIVGIVEDFHFESLRETIGPLGMFLGRSAGRLAIRYQAADSKNLLKTIEDSWNGMAPDQPFSYQFMDESFGRMYLAERRIGSIAMIFSILAIFVSCLGLFGLASFITEQRTKEIGIRKVLGASISGVVALLSKDFLKLVLISMVIAIPFAWWAMNNWLQDFAYRTNFKWQIFVLAGILALAIAFLTISFQSIKAALINPVDSIKSE